MRGALDVIPEPFRETARGALALVLGERGASAVTALKGGVSGALIYRVDGGERPFVLRLEPDRVALEHRRRGFACMQAAAAVGVAPRVHFADPTAGVAVMDFIAGRPIATYPGGRPGLARAVGVLIAQVQTAQPFPAMHGDEEDLVAAALRSLTMSGRFAPGRLDRHHEALERIRAVAPWEPRSLAPSHNDPNPRNLLYDGERLWLVDWELASRNDPLFDLAIATLEIADTPELEDALLTAALGRAPDAVVRARLRVVRQLARLFYGCIALDASERREPDESLGAMSPAAFQAAAAQGRLAPDEIGHAFGKMSLAAFVDGCADPDFERSLALLRRA